MDAKPIFNSPVVKRIQGALRMIGIEEKAAAPMYDRLFRANGLDINGIYALGDGRGPNVVAFPFTPTLESANFECDSTGSSSSSSSPVASWSMGQAITLIDTCSSLHAFCVRGKGNTVSVDLAVTSVRPVLISKPSSEANPTVELLHRAPRYLLLSTVASEGDQISVLEARVVADPRDYPPRNEGGEEVPASNPFVIALHTKCHIPMHKTEMGRKLRQAAASGGRRGSSISGGSSKL